LLGKFLILPPPPANNLLVDVTNSYLGQGVEGKGLSWKAESLVCTARGSSAVLYVTIRTVDTSYLRQTFVVEVPPDLPFMRMNSNASLHCNNKDADQCNLPSHINTCIFSQRLILSSGRYLITYAELLKMSWHVNPPTPYMQVFHVEQWNWVRRHLKKSIVILIFGFTNYSGRPDNSFQAKSSWHHTRAI